MEDLKYAKQKCLLCKGQRTSRSRLCAGIEASAPIATLSLLYLRDALYMIVKDLEIIVAGFTV